MAKYFNKISPVKSVVCNSFLLRQDAKFSMDLKKAVGEAERIIGYPVTFGTMQWTMPGDAMDTGSSKYYSNENNLSLLKTANEALNNCSKKLQEWRLLILLLSKAAGHSSEVVKKDKLEDGGVLCSQRVLAEATEMIRTGHLLHKGVINISKDQIFKDRGTINNENKLSLIAGDYLLVKAHNVVSTIRNQHISELVASALRDYAEGEFIGDRDPQNIAIPSMPNTSHHVNLNTVDHKIENLISYKRKFEPLDSADCIGDPVREWTMRNILSGGSLLGIGCQGVLHLAGHDEDHQNIGYIFGCHVALAWQAAVELTLLSSKDVDTFSLVSAPVLFALSEDNKIFDLIECSRLGVENVDYNKLKTVVQSGEALELTLKLYQDHSKAAIKLLEFLPRTKSVEALQNIIESLNVNTE